MNQETFTETGRQTGNKPDKIRLWTDEQRADFNKRLAKSKTAQNPSTIPCSPYIKNKPLRQQQWLQLLESFRNMPTDTGRPDIILKLAREGVWREIDGVFNLDETIELIIQAARNNNYIKLHGIRQLMSIVTGGRTWARNVYKLRKESSSPRAPTQLTYTSLVPLNTSTPPRLQRYVDDVEKSELSPATKRQIYIAAVIQREHPEWVTLVMSARATAAAVKVGKKYIGANWRKAEKVGFIGYNPGVSFDEVALNPELKSKSSEITLNLETYSDRKVRKPKVNLDDYVNQASNFYGYIKFRRQQIREERMAYLKNNDFSTVKQERTINYSVAKSRQLVPSRHAITSSPIVNQPQIHRRQRRTPFKDKQSDTSGEYARLQESIDWYKERNPSWSYEQCKMLAEL